MLKSVLRCGVDKKTHILRCLGSIASEVNYLQNIGGPTDVSSIAILALIVIYIFFNF